ncbi:MAG: hypothetical protein R8J94_17810 [Acidimicrobiia bacterium]|nr:hypothetical protein [Acidimicrobiia bacterium]
MTIRKLFTWSIAIAAFGAMLYTCALPGVFPADDDSAGFAGTYTVNGVDPLGVDYSGTVTIVETSVASEYEIEWIVTGVIHQGLGRLNGDSFVAHWSTIASGGGTGSGVASYTVQPDGRLLGSKTISGFDLAATEEIFPAP